MKLQVRLQAPASFWDVFEEWGFFFCLLFFSPNLVIPPTIRRLANLAGYVIALFVFIRHWKQLIRVSLTDIVLLLMFSFAMLSVFWAFVPDDTLISVRALLRTTIIGTYFGACFSSADQRKIISKILFLWGVASLLAAFVPGYGIVSGGGHAGNLVGIFSFKNSLGVSMALATIMAFTAFINGQGNRLVIKLSLLIAPIMVFMSGSKTSLVALFAAFSILPFYFFSRQYFKVKTALYAFTGSVSVIVTLVFFYNYETILETVVVDWLGKDLTFTGRFPLWAAIVRQGLERPILGFGHGGFWNTEYGLNVGFSKGGWPPLPKTGLYLETMHSHNGFVEVFVQLGIIGVILALAHFLILLVRLNFLTFIQKDSESLWMLQTVILMFVVNLTEASNILAASSFDWILYVAIALSSAQKIPNKYVLGRNARELTYSAPSYLDS